MEAKNRERKRTQEHILIF
ncbi:hypothetical protein OIU79_021616, partial [Salix purpurea]